MNDVLGMEEKMDKFSRMKELAVLLNKAARAYYQENREIMSNKEYDALYDELQTLEKELGTVLSISPTSFVGYEIVSELPKEVHETPMLSLDKTKEVSRLKEFLGEQKGLLSWKLDGLTVVLTYENGELERAVTRGNGEIGEVVTANARTFVNLPHTIPFQGHLVLRGEAVITYSDFQKMNEAIAEEDSKYKNPRNLCAGSVRQLNSAITASRNVRLIAFALIEAEEDGIAVDFENSNEKRFEWLKAQGFETVESLKVVTAESNKIEGCSSVEEAVETFAEKIKTFDIPSDGLVLLMDDIAYGESLGRTTKFPRNAIAYKWKDETATTILREIHWSPSRTGLINPVAVFDSVELEGTSVSRASVHNLSIMEELELGIGDEITVFKANMIIPQIAENHTRSKKMVIPSTCPVCGGETQVRQINDVKSLYCTNPDCQAKKIKSFELFVSRDAMNIDGLSTATIEKFIDAGFIKEYADIFQLDRYKDAIVTMEGFGARSYENIIKSTEKARHTTLPRVLYSLGILGIGLANAKVLCKSFHYKLDVIRSTTVEELTTVDGIGQVLASSIVDYFANKSNNEALDHLLALLDIETFVESDTEQIFKDKVFVITGSVNHFKNRNEMKAYIEERGGKVTGSVSAKTSYLINNDVTSNSSKNKKARELGIEILSEEDLLQMGE